MSFKIAIIGMWHLGETYSACLADMGHTVIGIDENKVVINNLKKGIAPLEEPGLKEIIVKNIKIYDPMAIKKELLKYTNSQLLTDPYEAAKSSDVVLVLSPDPNFRLLDFKKLASLMSNPLIIDAQNILADKEIDIINAGFRYVRMGK